MSRIDDRIAELGISIPPQASAPAGSYVPAATTGSLIFTAGQLPFIDGELPVTGKVGVAVSPEAAHECARTCARSTPSPLTSVRSTE